MTSRKHNILKPLLAMGVALFIVSCSSMMTMKDQFRGVNELLVKRNFAGAASQLESTKDKLYEAKDRVMYYLDLGMLYHYMGKYKESNELLTKAEYAIEELFTASITKAATSILLNDNALDYVGEDYEDIYLNVFKALNFLHLGLQDDAIVEIKRINNKLNLLEQKYRRLADEYNRSKDALIQVKTGTNNFYNSALARYISMLIYRSENEWDNARIDRDKVYEAFDRQANIYTFSKPNLAASLNPTNKARVSMFSFIGRNPDKIAANLRFASEKDRIVLVESAENAKFKEEITGFTSIYWKDVPQNLYFKYSLPVMKRLGSRIASGQVQLIPVAGQPGVTAPGNLKLEAIESIDNVAYFTFNVKKPMTYLRAILRGTAKGIASAQGKKEIQENTRGKELGSFLSFVADVAVDISENADLRISHFFPSWAYVGEIDVVPGKYTVIFEYFDSRGNLVFRDDQGVRDFAKTGINLVESFCLE
ncbi:MAG: hypothetical protein EHM28_11205 [Spirochaetaceae bacterium]|nr:MAG: hypothetical protein EHM28_11205 [Spirochaetaceae bacterium]